METLSGRERILKEATRLFVSQGYKGISMREIGDACGMTKAALYYHFKNKEDLLREIIKTSLEKTKSGFPVVPAAELSIRAQVGDLVKRLFLQEPDDRGVLHLIFVEAPHLEDRLRQEITCLYHDQFLSAVEALLLEGVQRGELQTGDPRLAARMLLGMMYPFIHPRHTETQKERQHTADTILSVFFDGVSGDN